jgi:predicted TIM-barrel fold metal-dependent hydrolase
MGAELHIGSPLAYQGDSAMEIKYGLISSDSHAQLDQDAFTQRMSKARFGERIPHLIESRDPAHMVWKSERPVHRWLVAGKVVDLRSPTNCPALWDDPLRLNGPQRWEEVPKAAYDPAARLKVLDADGVDGEVLFPNPPVQNATFFQADAEFELGCVQAYNEAIAEWRQVSERYIPLALVPHLNDIETIVSEVERAAKLGCRGVLMVAEPSFAVREDDRFGIAPKNPALAGLKHFCDPFWEPLWAACQDLQLPIHWHGSGGVSLPVPLDKTYDQGQMRSAFTAAAFSAVGQFLPHLVFSGVLDRYPRLHWVCAETGMGWMNYVIEACDDEWERRRLWTEGIASRPGDALRRQVHSTLWYERQGVASRNQIGVDNLLWMTDFPHNVSTYPDTWNAVEHVLAEVPQNERRKILYENAVRLYKLE